MSFNDESLGAEAPWIITLCSSAKGKTLTKEKERELVVKAQLAIRPVFDKGRNGKAKKDTTNRWLNRPAHILKTYGPSLNRRPDLKAKLQHMSKVGDKAITELLEHNYRLIISIARKLQGRGMSWEDMIQHGSDGFVYAVAKFDLKKNFKLSTYASQWIRQRINRAIEQTAKPIRLSNSTHQRINELKFIYKQSLQLEQEKPSSEEIAERYNLHYAKQKKKKDFKPMTKEEAEELGRSLMDIQSLDSSSGDDPNLLALHYIKDEKEGPEVTTETSMDKEYLQSVLCTLPSGDRIFIQFKYGLVDNSPKTDAKTAEMFKIPIKEVKAREAQILQSLATMMEAQKTSLDMEVEIFSVILISAPTSPGGDYLEGVSSVLGKLIPKNLPAKVFDSVDKDQMLLLCRRFIALGCRAEVISSF